MHFQLPTQGAVCSLGQVSSTLLIPLAARAYGASLFPTLDPHDRYASLQLQGCGVRVQGLSQDQHTVLNVLWRTSVIKRLGQEFFSRHPQGTGINLGAGLAQHFQWLDNGRNHWIDADLPEVLQLRQGCERLTNRRALQRPLDLSSPGWWKSLPLGRGCRTPLFLLLEGVLMYFEREHVQAILSEIGDNAPVGSEVLCDFISPWGVGCASLNASVAATHAQFRWGTRHAQDLADMHPRLHLLGQRSVAEAYGDMGPWIEALCKPWTGGALYAMAHLQIWPD